MVRKHGQTSRTLQNVLSESDQSTNETNSEVSPNRSSNRIASQKQQNSRKQQPSTSKQNQPAKSKTQQKDVSSSSRNQQQSAEQQVKGNTKKRKNVFPKHIREIMRLQNTTENQIPKAPFTRLLREILQKHGDFRMQSAAIFAIQEATEFYFVQLFDDAYKLTLHRKRLTLHPSDISLVLYIRGQSDPGVR